MRKRFKILCSIFMAITMCLGLSVTSFASDSLSNEMSLNDLKGELIYYYKEGNAYTDVLRTLDEIRELSEDEYDQWKQIIEYWDYTENSMVEYVGIAPDGLPDTNNHAFVVLGFALNSDGSMTEELKGRCQVAYDSAMKYPNAYVVLAGGGTAADNKEVTEAGQMKEYMVNELNFDESRIILENKSMTTVQNAQFTFNILYNQYDISTITMISSQYHLKRASLLYYAQSLFTAKDLGETPIELVGNAGWLREDKTSETMDQKASSLSQLAGVRVPNNAETSVLQSLVLEGKTTYTKGEALDLNVIAQYDIDNYTRDITEFSTIEGYDPNTLGTQTVKVTYSENNVTKIAEINVTVEEIVISKVNNFKLQNITTNSVELLWENPDNTVGLVEYVIYKNGKEFTTVPVGTNTVTINKLRKNTNYGFKVTAKYSNGKESKPQSINARTKK